MPTFEDNVEIIKKAIYGKEMRPAISEALTQSWDSVKNMMTAVGQLNTRVDNLSGGSGGGTVDPDNPSAFSGSFADIASRVMTATSSTSQVVDVAILI